MLQGSLYFDLSFGASLPLQQFTLICLVVPKSVCVYVCVCVRVCVSVCVSVCVFMHVTSL